jgi:long-chain fatty acid transport protein
MEDYMRNFRKISSLAAMPAAFFAYSGAAHASAFYLQEQSVKGAGRAFSGEVADQGPESLWWNPASIADQQGCAGSLGVSGILPKGNVVNQGTVIVRPGQAPRAVGGDARSANPIRNGLLPSGAISCAITPRLSIGLAATSPFSFTTDYPLTSWVRYTADRTKLRTYDLQPSVAFMVTPQIAIGAALNAEYSDAQLSNALPNLSPLLADGHQELKGNGWDFGYTVGAQFRTGPITLAASYKSKIEHTLKGSVTTTGLLGPLAGQNGRIATDARFSTPWQITFGARAAVSPKVTLNAQAVRSGWSEFDAIRVGAPLNVAIPEGYHDTWSYAGGIDVAVAPQLTLRAGVQHDESPTSNGDRDARVPDADRWNFATGASIAVTKAFTLDTAVSYIMFKNAKIDRLTAAYAGTAAQTPIVVNGELQKANAVVLSLGGRLRF